MIKIIIKLYVRRQMRPMEGICVRQTGQSVVLAELYKGLLSARIAFLHPAIPHGFGFA